MITEKNVNEKSQVLVINKDGRLQPVRSQNRFLDIMNIQTRCPHQHCVAIPEEFAKVRCLDCGAKCRLAVKK
jgi:hypothetical protein